MTVSAAPNSCGLSWGYWKNHTSDWPVRTLTLGAQAYTFSELTALLDGAVKGDASIEMTHQLIAAKLNVLNGTNPATAKGAIATADLLLSQYAGRLPYKVAASTPAGAQMTAASAVLEYFNRDGAAQPGCVAR